ncbi:MAG: helix-turn-helix transcriptional regulator [Deltaproteobacteria bacterium]|nr:helix-turn-helix transcriptional regulator [Deltaproteobacteria bacterium]
MSWRGDIYLERGWLLYDGPVAPTSPHAHHAFQVMLASDLPIRIVTGEATVDVHIACIPADAPHAFASGSPRAAILYVAPESRAGRHLASRVGAAAALASWVDVAAALRGIADGRVESWSHARAVHDAVMERLVPADQRARPWPPAIQRLVALLPQRLDHELRLGQLAAELELSESRLAHLVTEYLGIPFRPYVLWLRLQAAAAEVAQGRTLTEAAHHAGFSDGAHLSRVFKRMFGIAPSEVAGFARWHVA